MSQRCRAAKSKTSRGHPKEQTAARNSKRHNLSAFLQSRMGGWKLGFLLNREDAGDFEALTAAFHQGLWHACCLAGLLNPLTSHVGKTHENHPLQIPFCQVKSVLVMAGHLKRSSLSYHRSWTPRYANRKYRNSQKGSLRTICSSGIRPLDVSTTFLSCKVRIQTWKRMSR